MRAYFLRRSFIWVAIAVLALTTSCADHDASVDTAGRSGSTFDYAIFNGSAFALVSNGSAQTIVGDALKTIDAPGIPASGGGYAIGGAGTIVASYDTRGDVEVYDQPAGSNGWNLLDTYPSKQGGDELFVVADPSSSAFGVFEPIPGAIGGPGPRAVGRMYVDGEGSTSLVVPGSASSITLDNGIIYVAGGPAASRVYASDDLGQSWIDLTNRLTDAGSEVNADSPGFGRPLALSSGDVIVPAIEHETTSSEADLYQLNMSSAAADLISRIQLNENFDGGGATPIAALSNDGDPIVVDNNDLVSGSTPTGTSVGAVPGAGSVTDLSFLSKSTGVAQVEADTCSSKSDCESNVSLYATYDGGQTWTSL